MIHMKKVYIIPEIDSLEQSINLIEQYDGAFEYNDFWIPSVLDDRRKQEEIIEYYARYRTDFADDTMHGAFLDIVIHSQDSLIREASIRRVYQSMDIAKRMGLRGVVFHTGLLAGFNQPAYLANWRKRNVEFFSSLAEQYPGQEIYIENMFDATPDEIAAFGEEVKNVANAGLCLDYAHGAVTDCSMETWVRQMAPYVLHMHINDNNLRDDLHQPVGEGYINWQEFHDLMIKYRIEASVLVEVRGCEAQKKSLEYMKKNHIFPFAV